MANRRWTVYCKEWDAMYAFSRGSAFHLYISLEELIESEKKEKFDENSFPMNGNEIILLHSKKLYDEVKKKSLRTPHKKIEELVFDARRAGDVKEVPLGWEGIGGKVIVTPITELPPVKSEEYHHPYEGEWEIVEGPETFDLQNAMFLAFVIHIKIRKKEKGPDWYERDEDTQTWVFSIVSIERVGLPGDSAYAFKGTAYPYESNPDFAFNIEADYNLDSRKGTVRILG